MNITIPKSVKIGWRKYRIVQGEHRSAGEGLDVFGEIQCERDKIYIYDKLTPDNKAVTLLHEILRGIFYMAGRRENFEDEALIECLSENLYQVLRDNPAMFKKPQSTK